MDPFIIKYYRNLLRNGFQNAGSIENPSIYLDSVGENLPVCGKMGQDYVHLFISMQGDLIADIHYLCNCDPTANVVFELLCSLLRGKTIAGFYEISPEVFYQTIGTRDEDFTKRIKASLELVSRGLKRYQSGAAEVALNPPGTGS